MKVQLRNLRKLEIGMDHRIEEMEQYAKEHHVPIMEKEGIEFLLKYIKEHSIHSILEIGTAIGYSAIRMCLVDPSITVTTIERDEERYQVALENITACNLQDRITVLLEDALTVELETTFDFIFIDAAKSQYIKFFEKFEKNLKDHGVIISDNLNFHGMTHTTEPILSRNVRGLVRKLNMYIDFLKENPKFDTTFFEIGDGVSVSIRKEEA